jgi:O-antigen ligase
MRKEKKLKKVSRLQFGESDIFFGGLIVLLPLFFSEQTLDPVLIPQLLALGLFFLLFFIGRFFLGKEILLQKPIFKNPAVWMLAGYLLTTILTSFVSINIKESYFFIAKNLLFVFVALTTMNLLNKLKSDSRRISLYFFAAIIISLMVGFNQYFKEVLPDPSALMEDGRPVFYKVTGFMAHKNLYTAALFMGLPFLAYGFFVSKFYWRVSFGIAIAFSLFMIFLLSSRAVWLGIIVASGFVLMFVIFGWKQLLLTKKLRNILLLSVIGTILALGIVVGFSQSESEFSPTERLKSIVNPEASNNAFRLKVWNLTTGLIKENFITGVGPGNWKIIALKEYSKFDFNSKVINWARPHNDFLWVFAEMGIFGFIFYIGMFLLAYFYLFSVFLKSNDIRNRILAVSLIGGFTGYLVISFFDFPLERIVHQVWLAIWIGTSIHLYMQLTDKQIGTKYPRWLNLLFAAIMFLPVVYANSVKEFEMQCRETRKYQDAQNWKLMLEAAKKIPVTFRNIDPEVMPVNYFLGLAYGELGDFRSAKEAYEAALEHHPYQVSVLNNIGLLYYNEKNYEKAILYLEKANAINEDYFDALMNLFVVYSAIGNYEKGLEYLERTPPELRDKTYPHRLEWVKGKIAESAAKVKE